MFTLERPYDDEGNPAEGHCSSCGCLRSDHHIGIDAHVIKGCPCGKCGLKRGEKFCYSDVLPRSVHDVWARATLTRGAQFTAINPFTPDEVWVEGDVERSPNFGKGLVVTGVVDYKRRTITLESA